MSSKVRGRRNRPRLFISRELTADSPVRAWAADAGFALHDESLLRFEGISYDPPTGQDWWFFYSRRGVRYAGPIPHNVKLAAIGSRTAVALLEKTGRVDFCGSGAPARVAEDFLAVAGGQRVFFLRARRSRRSVQLLLQDRVLVTDAVCYDNLLRPPLNAIRADIYVFTSPLSVAALVDHSTLAPGAKVIAMGPTTAAALAERGIESRWPGVAGEEGIVGVLQELAQHW